MVDKIYQNPQILIDDAKEKAQNNMYTTEDTAKCLLEMPLVIKDKNLKCEQVYYIFTENKKCSHIVILEGTKAIGLITRIKFMLGNSGAFGFSLHQKRPAINLATTDFLALLADTAIPEIASLAMQREDNSTYDPIIINDKEENFLGTIEIKKLLIRSSKLELENAKNANPLTGLPGNKSINKWLDKAVKSENYHILYGDLSNFKEYNDIYGFAAGDNLIQLCGQIMAKHGSNIAEKSKVGHIGGDDFIIVTRGKINHKAIEDICRDFDQEKAQYFKPRHLKDGFYQARNRQGISYHVPLTTLSLSIIGNKNFTYIPHIAEIAKAAAALKKIAKLKANEAGYSCAVYERRIYEATSRP